MLTIDFNVPAITNSMAERLAQGLREQTLTPAQFEAELFTLGAVSITPVGEHNELLRMVVFPDESMIVLTASLAPALVICGTSQGYTYSELLPTEAGGRRDN